MTRRQLSTTAKLEEKTKRVSGCEMDLSPEAIREAQSGEVCLRSILDLQDAGYEKPPWSTVEGVDFEIQQLYTQWEALQLQDGILYRNFLGTDGQVRWRQLLVSRSLRVALLQLLHSGPMASLQGAMKTQDSVVKMAYWRGWRADVALFCRWCIQCNRNRRGPDARQGELQQVTAEGPFTKIHVDLTGPTSVQKNGFVYLLTAINYFTKYLFCVPLVGRQGVGQARLSVIWMSCYSNQRCGWRFSK